MRGTAIALATMVLSCQDQGGPASTPGASAVPAAVTPEPRSEKLARSISPHPPPPDLDLAELARQLGCDRGRNKNPCGILAEFGRAGRFTGKTPSGESRWFGRAFVIEQGKERVEYVTLVSRQVPLAQVGAGDLPLMISLAPIPEEHQAEAPRLWSSMSVSSRHRCAQKSLACRYVQSYVPAGERGATNTTGPSVRLLTELNEGATYLRQASLKKLLVVRSSGSANAQPGDGSYAELWQASW